MRVDVASNCIAVAAVMALWWGMEIRNGALNRRIEAAVRSHYT